jgi:hypothetical protein
VGAGVIQITPQMRILVAIEAVDGRKGIEKTRLRLVLTSYRDS